MPQEDKKRSKCVSYTEREKVLPKVKGGSKRSGSRSKKGQVTGVQMVAYIRAQEELRKIPVTGMFTPKRQLKLADIFTPTGHNICLPESRNEDVQSIPGSKADIAEFWFVQHAKGADNFEDNHSNINGDQGGQKKFTFSTD